MSDVDVVAEAICEAEGHHWFSQFPDTQDTYRRMAQAAIDALGLTEDRRRINPQTRPKPCETCGHLKGVHSIPCPILNLDHTECGCMEYRYTLPNTAWQARLVSPWTDVPA